MASKRGVPGLSARPSEDFTKENFGEGNQSWAGGELIIGNRRRGGCILRKDQQLGRRRENCLVLPAITGKVQKRGIQGEEMIPGMR